MKIEHPHWPQDVETSLEFTRNKALISVALFLKENPGSFLKDVSTHINEVAGYDVHRSVVGKYLNELNQLGLVSFDPKDRIPGYPLRYSLNEREVFDSLQSLAELFRPTL